MTPDHDSNSASQPDDRPERALESRADLKRLFSPRRLAVQLLGFVIGIGLLAWCIHEAVKGGDWERVRHADLRLVAALAGCTLLSLAANGALFWVALLPMRRLKLLHVQHLINVSSLLNYTPIRAGLIARLLFHRRVDGMGWGELAAWLAAVMLSLGIAMGACLGASLVRPTIDGWWLLLVGGGMAAGVVCASVVVKHPLFAKYGMGLHLLLSNRRVLIAALALRMVDLAAFTGRLAAAMAILGIKPPSTSHVILLAIVAMGSNLVPIGRLGFREWAVARVAGFAQGLEEQMALIDSAGEAMVFIPIGIISLIWYRRAWKRGPIHQSST